MIVYLIYRAAELWISLLPLRFVYLAGRIKGRMAYYLLPPYRKLVLNNLRIAFGGEKSEAELRALAREHFATLGANLLSSVKVSTMRPEAVRGLVDIENGDGLFAPAKEGRGILMVISHLGNWELYSQLAPIAPPGLRSSTIYQPLGNRYLDRHVREMRGRFGLIPFDRRRGFSEPIALLREPGLVGVLVDQHAGDGGVWAPFFGRLASTSPLAATLALRTNAVLVPVSIYSLGKARWKMCVHAPLPSEGKTPEELTAAINQALEAQIRTSPRDWFWVHNRWKTPRPDFLLAGYKRGVELPPGQTAGALKPFRILIRSTNWLGDAVMSAPAVRAIRAGRPDARITVAAPAKLADFWKTMPEVEEVIAIEKGEGVFAVGKKLRRDFDAAFVFPNSVRSALEVAIAGVPRRVGYDRPWRGKLIDQIVPEPKKPGPPRHEVHHYLDLAKNAGAAISKSYLEAPSHPGHGTWLGLCPGAEYGEAKRWFPARFAEAAESVQQQTGLRWRLFGVEKDRAIGEEIAPKLAGCENLIGKTTLGELIERLRECRLLLTNDTGTMHLAAHLGVPVVAIFGSTEPELTGPLGRKVRVVRHHVSCSPCFLRECPLEEGKLRCMEAVTSAEVAEAVTAMLALS